MEKKLKKILEEINILPLQFIRRTSLDPFKKEDQYIYDKKEILEQVKKYSYKIYGNSDNVYRIRLYDRDSHDDFEEGKGRWLNDVDTIGACTSSHISSPENFYSEDDAINGLLEYFIHWHYKPSQKYIAPTIKDDWQEKK